MKVQVIGSGCPTCKKLYEITQQAVADLEETIEVEYISGQDGFQKLLELGAMGSPVLANGNKILMTGFSNDQEKIKNLILDSEK